ncbi:hypothetical protein BH10PSE8_BH10PSE8_18700 [soil metagenome]
MVPQNAERAVGDEPRCGLDGVDRVRAIADEIAEQDDPVG